VAYAAVKTRCQPDFRDSETPDSGFTMDLKSVSYIKVATSQKEKRHIMTRVDHGK